MADEEQLNILRRGVASWNQWREKNPDIKVDLSGAYLLGVNLGGAHLGQAYLGQANLRGTDLSGAYLGQADLNGAHLSGANLRGTNLRRANLYGANLREAHLWKADLDGANLHGTDLGGANLDEAYVRAANLEGAFLWRARLWRADLGRANLRGVDLSEAYLGQANLCAANLQGANLRGAQLIQSNLCDATLTGSRVYGASVWDIKVDEGTKQQNLIITTPDQRDITVDNLKVAQFIHLLLNNREIRDVIDTITSKAVLILGRFSEERKPVLNAIRHELRKSEYNYLPIVFDFQPPTTQTTLETVKTLASMSRFVIADLTDARSVLMELGAIVPAFPSVAMRLMIKRSEHAYGHAGLHPVLPVGRWAHLPV